MALPAAATGILLVALPGLGSSPRPPQAATPQPLPLRWKLRKGDAFRVTAKLRITGRRPDRSEGLELDIFAEILLTVQDATDADASCALKTTRFRHKQTGSGRGLDIEFEDGKLKKAEGEEIQNEREEAEKNLSTPTVVHIDPLGRISGVPHLGNRPLDPDGFLPLTLQLPRAGSTSAARAMDGLASAHEEGDRKDDLEFEGTQRFRGMECALFRLQRKDAGEYASSEISAQAYFAMEEGFLLRKTVSKKTVSREFTSDDALEVEWTKIR